jgi:hypothetical protein
MYKLIFPLPKGKINLLFLFFLYKINKIGVLF